MTAKKNNGSEGQDRTTIRIDPAMMDQIIRFTGIKNNRAGAVKKALDSWLLDQHVKFIKANKGKMARSELHDPENIR